jgi:hypothetical protein
MSVTSEHEALHRVFQHDPGLYSRAVERSLGVKLPVPHDLSELNVDLTEIRPVERRADSVLRAEFPADGAGGAGVGPILIVESQTEEDKLRRRRWPYYIAFVRDKYDCQVVLLVVCSKKKTAEWAREPIEVGEPGAICMVVTPLVLGPDNVPAVVTVDDALADLPFAVFSAFAHSRSRGRKKDAIIESLATALKAIDVTAAAELAEFTEVGLGKTAAGTKWRALMATRTFPYASEQRSQGREEGRQEGLAEGRQEGLAEGRMESRAADILLILNKRKIEVDEESRERIKSCTDMKMLEKWLGRSLTAAKVGDLFKD